MDISRYLPEKIAPDLLILSVLCAALSLAGGTPYYHSDFIHGIAIQTVASGGNPHPDLPYRKMPGPFIEIYCRDPRIAQKIADTCARDGIDHELLSMEDGYYYKMFVGRGGPLPIPIKK
jgi:hypothetical protein